MTDPHSTLLKTALSLIDGYNKWDIDGIMEPRAANCTQKVYPERLGRPALGNDDYRKYFGAFMPHFKGVTVKVLDVIEDQKNHKVTIHASSAAETPVGPYANEYMLVMHMTEDDRQIVYFKQFVDSGPSQEFFPRLQAYISEQSN